MDTELKAGRGLDALIAEKVMKESPPEGFEPQEDEWTKECWDEGDDFDAWKEWTEHWPPHYSEDIRDAWEVVEKMLECAYGFELEFGGFSWHCRFDPDPLAPIMSANTAPLAICRGAWKAIEGK